MWPDRVLNPRPLALELDALTTALRGPAHKWVKNGIIGVVILVNLRVKQIVLVNKKDYIYIWAPEQKTTIPQKFQRIFSPLFISM